MIRQRLEKLDRFSRGLAERVLYRLGWHPKTVVADLVWNRLDEDTTENLRAILEDFTDEHARVRYGAENPVEDEHLRRVERYFHAWRVDRLMRLMGPRLAASRVLDVGDVDGMVLKHLGKKGIGFNLALDAIRRIEQNGIEACQGDGHKLPFDDGEFDYVLCFETLEHVESPHQVLLELARVCKSDGRVFVSIPWAPHTFIHPRDPDRARGSTHIFEFCKRDFDAIVSHSPLRTVSYDVCWILGKPRTMIQRLFLILHFRRHIVAWTFRGFQFFELALRDQR